MAAKHHVSPGQLKMFMSADEITAHYQPLDMDRKGFSDIGPWETDDALYSRKREEWGPYGQASIQREGVKDPVHLGTKIGSEGKPQITGGHHRIAASQKWAPDKLMPVLHHEGGLHDMGHMLFNDDYPYKYT